jgi:hypothetical protein
MGISVDRNYGYNMGLEMTNCYMKYFDHREKELNSLINKMSATNIDLKIIADTTNKLSHAKSKGKDLDPNQDEQLKKFIVCVHKRNPAIFDDKIKGLPEGWDSIDEIDAEQSLTLDQRMEQMLGNIDLSRVTIDTLTEKDIDVILQGLDAETKMSAADLNELMMKINNKYEDRSQMTENARQVVKEAGELNQSILRKIRG